MLPQVNGWLEFVSVAFVKVIGHVSAAIFSFWSQVASEPGRKVNKHNPTPKHTHTDTHNPAESPYMCCVTVV